MTPKLQQTLGDCNQRAFGGCDQPAQTMPINGEFDVAVLESTTEKHQFLVSRQSLIAVSPKFAEVLASSTDRTPVVYVKGKPKDLRSFIMFMGKFYQDPANLAFDTVWEPTPIEMEGVLKIIFLCECDELKQYCFEIIDNNLRFELYDWTLPKLEYEKLFGKPCWSEPPKAIELVDIIATMFTKDTPNIFSLDLNTIKILMNRAKLDAEKTLENLLEFAGFFLRQMRKFDWLQTVITCDAFQPLFMALYRMYMDRELRRAHNLNTDDTTKKRNEILECFRTEVVDLLALFVIGNETNPCKTHNILRQDTFHNEVEKHDGKKQIMSKEVYDRWLILSGSKITKTENSGSKVTQTENEAKRRRIL